MNTPLSPSHLEQLTRSAISPEVIEARGCGSLSRAQSQKLVTLGFSEWQAKECVPCLLFPSVDATGTKHYQVRPDNERKDRPKYVTPAGKGTYGLDIPPSVRDRVLASSETLWITEGCKKADAAVSAGLCCVSLPGVWMFTRNKKPLPDWNLIPLQGRSVIVCYDSDAMTKSSVYEALRRFANLLKQQGAAVSFCYLPDDGYTKVGLDDYLAAGHTVEELKALVKDKLEPIATPPVQALIAALNKKCKGKAIFAPKACTIEGNQNPKDEAAQNAQNTLIFDVLNAICFQKSDTNEAHQYWAGDAYNQLKLPHGTKFAVIDAAIGEGNRHQVAKWAVVCKAFSGDRDYFRHAAPFGILAEIASLPEALQDKMLEKYLQDHLSREKVRESIPEEYRRNKKEAPTPTPSLTHTQFLHSALAYLADKDNEQQKQYRDAYGETAVNIAITKLLSSHMSEMWHKLTQEIPAQIQRDTLSLKEMISEPAPMTIKGGIFDAQHKMPEPSIEGEARDEKALFAVTENATPNREQEPVKNSAAEFLPPSDEIEDGKDSRILGNFSTSANADVRLYDEAFHPEQEEEEPHEEAGFDESPEVQSTDVRGQLRADVRAAWKEANLTATPPLLARLLQREIESVQTALQTATVSELHILLTYGQTGRMPHPMRC